MDRSSSAPTLVLSAVLTLVPHVGIACVQTAEPPPTATARELNASPDRFADREVIVVGRLQSEGNYFSRKRRVWLVSDQGDQIDVTPWLPLSVPPAQTGSESRPATLSDYLGKRLELRAVLRRPSAADAAKNAATEPLRLEVKSAKILDR